VCSGLLDNASRAQEERDSGVFWIIYFVAWVAFLAGMIAASIAMIRDERPRWLSRVAFALNAVPFLLPGVLLGIHAVRNS
jgi:ABC-type spermidine/putrescine transport system permease subunit II